MHITNNTHPNIDSDNNAHAQFYIVCCSMISCAGLFNACCVLGYEVSCSTISLSTPRYTMTVLPYVCKRDCKQSGHGRADHTGAEGPVRQDHCHD